jgi:serine/threonine protein kinase
MPHSPIQMIGRKILNYTVISSIGKGGMGEVFLAKDETIKRYVAIKTLVYNSEIKDVTRQRFIVEANTLHALSHPNIVSFLHLHEDEFGLYLILEYVEGQKLNDYIDSKKGAIDEELAVNLMHQILDAIKHVHDKGFVHRDIKPSNIIVKSDNTIKVIDFGISKTDNNFNQGNTLDDNSATNHNLTKHGAQIGTIIYMSPEQVAGTPIDHRSDIYSLGVTFYHMLTGRNPYSDITNTYIISDKIVREPLANPQKVNPNVPDYLCKAVEKATNKLPKDRFQNCEEFKVAITKEKKRRFLLWNWKCISKISVIGLAVISAILLVLNYFITAPVKSEIELLPVKIAGKYAFVNRGGEIKIKPQFISANLFYDGLALVDIGTEKPKYGFINESGAFVIKAQYQDATSFSEGFALVINEEGKPMAIDKNGNIKFTSEANTITIFQEGLAAFSIKNSNSGDVLYGFMDTNGKTVIEPQYRNVSLFHDGVACAQLVVDKNGDANSIENCWILIDKTGKPINSKKFGRLNYLENGLSIVNQAGKYGVINKEGNFIIPANYEKLKHDQDLFIYLSGGKYGWLDAKGNKLNSEQFDDVGYFGNAELAPVKIGAKWGFINKEGDIKINPQFDSVYVFNGGYSPVWSGGKIGFIDLDGKYIVNPQFETVSSDYESFKKINLPIRRFVSSNFCDAESIVSQLNFNAPRGYDIKSTTYDDILVKKGWQSRDFAILASSESYLDYFNLGQEVNGSLWFFGTPNERKLKDTGNKFYKYVNEYNGKKLPDSYRYKISIIDCKDKFISALNKQLIADGYLLDNNGVYRNADRYVKFTSFQNTTNSKVDELIIDFGVIR